MQAKTILLKTTAHIAGLWYLLLIITGIYGLRYVQSATRVKGDAVATAHNILAHEFLFRTGIVSFLIGNIVFLFLVLAFYRLLKGVNQNQAKLMLILVLLQIPVSFFLEALSTGALMILKGELLKTMELAQKQDMAMLLLQLRGYGLTILEIFWGLWLMPLGILVYRSGFIPRSIGILLVAGGIGYVADCFVWLLFPDFEQVIGRYITAVPSLAELSIMLWLLIVGVKSKKTSIVLG